jgi:hypothetical protein
MDMQGSRQLAVNQQGVWDALNDPAVLKQCIPGCDKVESTGDNQYAIGVAVKVGPVSAKFSGKIRLSDMVAPQSHTISFEGQGGAAGFGKGESKVQLLPKDGGTELNYTVHATVGGKIAQLGQRLIDGAAKGMSEDFFQRFEDYLRSQHPEAFAQQDAATAAANADAPAANTGSKGAGIPVWVWALVAAVVLGLFLLLR